jgi:fructose-specific phosphotransferase system IIC component
MTATAPTPAGAARAVFGGAALGSGAVALVLVRVTDLRRAASPTDPPAAGPAVDLLLFGLLGAVVLASLATWLRSDPAQTLLRRAAMAMTAGLGVVLAAMLAVPLNEVAGRTGLLTFAALALPSALWLLLRRS